MSIKTQSIIVGLFSSGGLTATVWLLYDEWSTQKKIVYTLYAILVGVAGYWMAMNSKRRS
ncbi:hypothetical protein R70723_22980 [Paenibacillus sp. FSL R7-0273]|uniref:hypothetical protein n=1 Tax=Paenibacillus sp. FSL R7-0273 TaxID=1536772 RepID=UPI0004F7A52D|nr:hypothetical protein [Paenibacillus sp. FSL R7-0273]AIQ48460.1 hypothetical protein R70723_22980 [Paenibacillus sp. FSL R7-0273]OMF86331.1 hypothetical protein BK144_26415 [Paenibacillus sp. FSL R7-0273]